MNTTIFGDGPLGTAIAAAFRTDGTTRSDVRLLGRPAGLRHDPAELGSPDLVVEASRSDAVAGNVELGLAAGSRRFVIATTGWDGDRDRIDRRLREHGAAAVVAPNLSVGAALFFRLVERAAELCGSVDDFDPFVVEWHRRSKRDRPSGTAKELARRLGGARDGRGAEPEIAVIRAGSSPGMHLVGFDAPGETIELRLTARDRSAYAGGALVAADWLRRESRAPGIHAFDDVIDELLVDRAVPAFA